MADETAKYTSTAEVQDYWIKHVAPNYFDFDVVNNYRSGVFGYINEVMSTVTMDTHQAINIARREFYPVTAQYPTSIYKMAALQKIGLPRATPASCKAVLLLDRDEVITNSTYKNGVYTCVIDNTVQILADDIPFTLLYPIVIISNNTSGEWMHTIHYDKTMTNDLDTDGSGSYYITNKTINQDGKKYLLLSVNLKQTSRESITQLVAVDSLVETVSLLFSFEGNLANFEVFYAEDPDSSEEIQLVKLMQGQAMVESPFCYYRMLNSNLIELSFPKNIYFSPALNSEIRMDVYTSSGKDGEFESYSGTLACSMDSEKYPYNNNMTMLGVVNGSCSNGKNVPTFEEYTAEVQKAYVTNNTITTSHDLQMEFDAASKDVNGNKIIFRKKRSDAFSRDYGAYCLLKDSLGNIVPTNTLTVNMTLSDFDTYSDVTQKAFIKPGTLFEYDPASDTADIYTAKKVTDLSLSSDLSEYDSGSDRFIYTNPFLISANLNPNLIGFYNNSIDETRSVAYSYLNDSSVIQFIGSALKIYRNSINGENFYKFSMVISPTTELDANTIVSIPSDADEDYYIRAEQNGKIVSVLYDEDGIYCNGVYEDDSTFQIRLSSGVSKTEDGDYEYITGYTLNVEVYGSFIEGDVIATKKVTDLGKIRGCLEFQEVLYTNQLYIPMIIDDYNEELNTYTMSGYISTDDIMDSNGTLLVENGVMEQDGHENDNVSIPFTNLKLEVSVFYRNDDINYTHKYSDYDYYRLHTLTNTYVEDSESGVSLIQHIDYIRSTMTFSENPDDVETDVDDEEDYIITIKEIPFAKANWIKSNKNFSYLINTMMKNYTTLQTIYRDLENNYGIDLKFYNTYGKSKFFKAGIRKDWKPLSRVNVSFRFGIYLSSVGTNQETFLNQFRSYVKDAVESINSSNSQSIYIMNLIRDIENNFKEIGFVEYYGFDDHETDVQKIEPVSTTGMSSELLLNYIPEFINICTTIQNGENVPDIDVEFLNEVEE